MSSPCPTARFILLPLCLAASAYAQPPGPGQPDASAWGLGLAVVSTQEAYKGIDREIRVLPLLSFENRYLKLSGPSLDLKLPGWSLGDAQRLNFSAVAKLFGGGGYEAGDSPFLAGMAERKSGFWAGGKVEWENDLADVKLEWLGDEVQNYQVGEVDVRAVAEEAARYLQRMAQAKDVRLVLRHPGEGVSWPADRGALFTLLKNLLENAIEHSPPGARVDVDVGATSLTVRDWGPGASDEQLSKVFLRFWRGAHRRDEGAGLGLSICHEIATAHGWSLAAGRAEPGLRVLLSRPLHAPPQP